MLCANVTEFSRALGSFDVLDMVCNPSPGTDVLFKDQARVLVAFALVPPTVCVRVRARTLYGRVFVTGS